MDGVHIGKHGRKAMSAEASLGSRDKFIRRTITQVPWKVPEATNCHDYKARVVVEVRVRKKNRRSGGHQPLGLWKILWHPWKKSSGCSAVWKRKIMYQTLSNSKPSSLMLLDAHKNICRHFSQGTQGGNPCSWSTSYSPVDTNCSWLVPDGSSFYRLAETWGVLAGLPLCHFLDHHKFSCKAMKYINPSIHGMRSDRVFTKSPCNKGWGTYPITTLEMKSSVRQAKKDSFPDVLFAATLY